MKPFFLLLLFAITSSCIRQNENSEAFAYGQFPIMKSALGPIKVGSRISNNDKYLNGLDTSGVDAFEYHYDGGGNAINYSHKGKLLFALMPARDSDSIIAIMVFDPDFKTANGLGTHSNVKDIVTLNPNSTIKMDLMGGGEVITDENNNHSFIFETPENKLIATYPDIDAPGRIYRANVMPDWITIK